MKDAYYFPHFSNARHDRKIKRIRKELGVEGYGIFFMLLEVLRDQADYRYPIEDIDLLADEFGTSEQKVRTVIANYQLFQVDEDEMFFSSNLIMFLQPYLEAKERKRINGIRGNLIRYGYLTKEESDNLNNAEIMDFYIACGMGSQGSLSDRLPIAIKGKETKEKKQSKVNKVKKKYGEYQHILLTDEEYKKLKDKVDDRDKWIKKVDEGIALKGYKYKSHYLAILKWYRDDKERQKTKAGIKPKEFGSWQG